MTITLKDQIKQIDTALNNLHTPQRDLENQRSKLAMQRYALIPQIIIEDKMLKGTRWQIHTNVGGNDVALECHDDARHTEKIYELLYGSYANTQYKLDEGIFLMSKDYLTLFAGKIEQFLPFVRKHGLVIEHRGLEKKLVEQQKIVALIEAVIGDNE